MLKLTMHRVKPAEETRLRNWMAELNRRSVEVKETLAREGTREEQAYLISTSDGPILIYAIDASDPDRAQHTFSESTLPLDQEHREVMSQALGLKVNAELLYRCSRD